MLYQPLDPHRKTRMSGAFAVALLIHVCLLIAISRVSQWQLEREIKTIPVIMIADRSEASKAAIEANTSASQQADSREFISTASPSSFRQPNGKAQSSPTQASARNTEQHSDSDSQEQQTLPRIPQTKRSQSSRAQQAREGLRQIFDRSGQVATIEQRSNESDREALSEYEQALIRRLAKDTLYDPFHDIIKNRSKDQDARIQIAVELSLLANGAIKRARIVESSGIREIDELTLRAVYQESPYPPPPPGDISKGYRYVVPIDYIVPTNKR